MITDAGRAERRNWVGASDVSAIVGVDPYRTAYDVWLEKSGALEDIPGGSESEAIDLGNRLEPVILDMAEDRLGPLVRGELFHCPGVPLAANLDGRIADSAEPVEAKTAALTGPLSGQWGDDGSDEIPDGYLLQLHAQMLCTGADRAHLAALIGQRGFALFRVRRDDMLCDLIVRRVHEFWSLVESATPPADSAPSMDVVKRIRRVPEKTVVLDPALIQAWRRASEVLDEARRDHEAAKSAVIAALGDAEAGMCNGVTYTYYEYHRRGYTVRPCTYRELKQLKQKG